MKRGNVFIFTVLCFLMTMLISLFVGCDEDSPTSSDSITKFPLLASTWGSRGKVDLYLTSSYLPERVPIVTINGVGVNPLIDEIYIWWELEDILAGTNVTYTVNLDDVPLSGSFTIPGSIALVTCNGIQCNDFYSSSIGTDILKSNSYTFSWAAANAPAYMISYSYYDGDEWKSDYSLFSTTASFTIAPQDSIRWGIDFSVSIYGSEWISAGRTPDASSSNAYMYHDIRGPRFNAEVDAVSSLTKRTGTKSKIELIKMFHEKLENLK